jgi:acetyl esterase/lipase
MQSHLHLLATAALLLSVPAPAAESAPAAPAASGSALQGTWQPPGAEARYRQVLAHLREVESYTRFFATEARVITHPTDAYLAARWDCLAFQDGLQSATPDRKKIASFMAAAKACAGEASPSALKELEKSMLLAGVELIVGKPAIQVDNAGLVIKDGLTYATCDGYPCKLDLFLPAKTTGPIPCIVFIHGGGWEVHKRAKMRGHAALAARHGYAACTIDYRMLPGVTPVECVQDVKAAVRWVRAHAADYGIDPNRIGASGNSAGAHLTAVLATTADDPALEGNGGNPGISSRIQAAVGFATPGLTGRVTWPISRLKPGQEPPDWFWKVSPYRNITPDDAPMLFIHGASDTLVSPDEPRDLQKKFADCGIKTGLLLRPGAGHVFYLTEKEVACALAFFDEVFKFTPPVPAQERP